jgi:hypothetical protein
MVSLDAYVQQIVDAAPPLTQAQKDRLAVLLNADHTSAQRSSPNDTEIARRVIRGSPPLLGGTGRSNQPVTVLCRVVTVR